MDKDQAAKDIITAALPLVPFDGWTQATLKQAAIQAGYKSTDAIRVFSGGGVDAASAYLRLCDEQMLDALRGYNLETMKIRERIALAVRIRIELYGAHKEASRRALTLIALPLYAHRTLKSLYATVDDIWHAIGDTSTDFNFYTKRLTLAAVYSTTLLHWLDDESPGCEHTWEFLARRIENVMQFEKLKQRVRSAL